MLTLYSIKTDHTSGTYLLDQECDDCFRNNVIDVLLDDFKVGRNHPLNQFNFVDFPFAWWCLNNEFVGDSIQVCENSIVFVVEVRGA